MILSRLPVICSPKVGILNFSGRIQYKPYKIIIKLLLIVSYSALLKRMSRIRFTARYKISYSWSNFSWLNIKSERKFKNIVTWKRKIGEGYIEIWNPQQLHEKNQRIICEKSSANKFTEFSTKIRFKMPNKGPDWYCLHYAFIIRGKYLSPWIWERNLNQKFYLNIFTNNSGFEVLYEHVF